jgi:hypothetical protein
MITIFAAPKPFKGRIETIQKNAIGSWMQLRPQCEIILFGGEVGTAEAAEELGVRHVPEVATNEHGTPLLNDLFEKTERMASHDLLAYVNCDIILMSDFIRAVENVNEWTKSFLMVGECRDLQLNETLDFDRDDWEQRLCVTAREIGKSRGARYVDYFVFPRGFYQQVPPFAIGRAGFDNWLIWSARASKNLVVDATRAVTTVHQNHDYSHVPGGQNWSYRGAEAKRNCELAGGTKHFFYICDATHRLQQAGIKRNFGAYFRLGNYWDVAKSRWLRSLGWGLVEWTRPLRHPLGLRIDNIQRLRRFLSRQK